MKPSSQFSQLPQHPPPPRKVAKAPGFTLVDRAPKLEPLNRLECGVFWFAMGILIGALWTKWLLGWV